MSRARQTTDHGARYIVEESGVITGPWVLVDDAALDERPEREAAWSPLAGKSRRWKRRWTVRAVLAVAAVVGVVVGLVL